MVTGTGPPVRTVRSWIDTRPLSVGHGPEAGVVGALLGLLGQDVVEAAEQHAGVLHLVPHPQQRADRAVGQHDQAVEGHQLPDGELAAENERARRPTARGRGSGR